MRLQNIDVTCEVPLRDPFCYVPSTHGCIHLAFTSALAWDFPPSIPISFHFPFASISPFLATHHCLSALFSPVTPQHQVLLLEQPVSHHHHQKKNCQWFLYSSSPLFAPSGGVGSREGGLGPQTSLHLWPKLLLRGEHGCISVHVVWTKFHLVVTLRMGFSTKLAAASANLSFLPDSGFSRPLYFSSKVPERSCQAEAG